MDGTLRGGGIARRDHRGSAVSLVVALGQARPCALRLGPRRLPHGEIGKGTSVVGNRHEDSVRP